MQDKLNITGPARENMLKLDASRKRALIRQYERKKEVDKDKQKEVQKTTSVHMSRKNTGSSYVASLTPSQLHELFERVLDDLDLKGAARVNVLRADLKAKRDLVLKYLNKKKAQGDPPPLPPRVSSIASTSAPSSNLDKPLPMNPSAVGGQDDVSSQQPEVDSQGNAWEMSPEWFISQIASRNTPLKALHRHLTAFRITLSLATPEFIRQFVNTEVAADGTSVKGLQCFQSALQRLYDITTERVALTGRTAVASVTSPPYFAGGSSPPASKTSAGGARGYADNVMGDELRLEILRCVRALLNDEVGYDAVLQTPNLVAQMVYCLGVSDMIATGANFASLEKIKTASLELRRTVANVLGAVCVISDEGHKLVVHGLGELAKYQKEPGRYRNLVSSLVDPFSMQPSASGRRQSVIADDFDVWEFRVAIMILLNGIVSAPEELETRVKIRRELESHGFVRVIQLLSDMNPPEEFITQIQAYDDDRIADTEDLEAYYQGQNEALSDPEGLVTQLVSTAKKLPDPEQTHYLVVSTLRNVTYLVSLLKQQTESAVSGGDSAADSADDDAAGGADDVQVRANIIDLLRLIEMTTNAVVTNVETWNKGSGSSGSTEESDATSVATSSASTAVASSIDQRQDKFQLLVTDLARGVEEATGIPMVGSATATSAGGDASAPAPSTTSGNLVAIQKELENLRQLYGDALNAAETQKKEIEFLRRALAKAEQQRQQQPQRIDWHDYELEDLTRPKLVAAQTGVGKPPLPQRPQSQPSQPSGKGLAVVPPRNQSMQPQQMKQHLEQQQKPLQQQQQQQPQQYAYQPQQQYPPPQQPYPLPAPLGYNPQPGYSSGYQQAYGDAAYGGGAYGMHSVGGNVYLPNQYGGYGGGWDGAPMQMPGSVAFPMPEPYGGSSSVAGGGLYPPPSPSAASSSGSTMPGVTYEDGSGDGSSNNRYSVGVSSGKLWEEIRRLEDEITRLTREKESAEKFSNLLRDIDMGRLESIIEQMNEGKEVIVIKGGGNANTVPAADALAIGDGTAVDVPPSDGQGVGSSAAESTGDGKGKETEGESVEPPPPPPGPGGPPPPPPPPGMGGPPPPPPGGLALGPKSLPFIKSKVPLKPLQWTKVPTNSIQTTIWNAVAQEAYKDEDGKVKEGAAEAEGPVAKTILDEKELQELFGKNEEKKSTPSTPTSRPVKTIVTLIRPERARNIGITLAGIRIPNTSIRDALWTLDDRILTADHLASLLAQCPTPEEIELVRAYEGEFQNLDNAGRYIRTIMDVPRLRERLQCMLFRRRWTAEMQELLPDLGAVESAIDQIQYSKLFSSVLQAVLVLGNYLNGDTFRGNAYGFKIDGLLQLRSIRAQSANARKTPTLLHYLARQLQEKNPDAVDFMVEMPAVELACRVSIPAIVSSIEALNTGIAQIRSEIAILKPDLKEYDRFVMILEPFVAYAQAQADKLSKRSADMQKNVRSMLTFFGEDPDQRAESPEEFFAVVNSFYQQLQKARKDNETADKREAELAAAEAEAKAKAEAEAELAAQTALRSGFLPANGQSLLKPLPGAAPFSKRLTVRNVQIGRVVGEGDLDHTMRALRQGTLARTTRKTLMRPIKTSVMEGTWSDTGMSGSTTAAQTPQIVTTTTTTPALDSLLTTSDGISEFAAALVREALIEGEREDREGPTENSGVTISFSPTPSMGSIPELSVMPEDGVPSRPTSPFSSPPTSPRTSTEKGRRGSVEIKRSSSSKSSRTSWFGFGGGSS
ncbi:hypothetical protein HK102_013942 [Quaeritorhiza haematococci]|nr:hypothetical protein HK102_013942 [Quaeritorhiza haematococci]